MMREPSLLELQRLLKKRILPGIQCHAERSEASKPLDPSQPSAAQDDTIIATDERLSAYANGYLARIEESLRETYEAVAHILGASRFHSLAHDYAAKYPSHDYNLSQAGRHLADFLKTHPLTSSFPFLPDLARFEWGIMSAFHAFDQTPVALEDLQKKVMEHGEQIRLVYHPSCVLFKSSWPVLDLWDARHTPVKEIHLQVEGRAQQILISRQNGQVRAELLTAGQYLLLEQLLSGRTLGEALESIAEQGESDQVSAWFAGWMQTGLITSISV